MFATFLFHFVEMMIAGAVFKFFYHTKHTEKHKFEKKKKMLQFNFHHFRKSL